MKTETLEELTQGRLGSKAVIHLVITRTAQIIALCLALVLVSWLILIENFAWLSFLAGAICGSLVYAGLRFFKNRLENIQDKPDLEQSVEVSGRVEPNRSSEEISLKSELN